MHWTAPGRFGPRANRRSWLVIGLIEAEAGRKWGHATSIAADVRKTEIVPTVNRSVPARADQPGRRGDTETTPGRCANLDYCSIGMQRILVEVPVNKPFVCPECGGKLRPPTEGRQRRPWVMPAIRLAILLLGIGLGTVQGYVMGRMQPSVKKAVATVSQETVEKVNAARALLGLPKLPAESIRMAPAAASAPPPQPAAAKSAPPPILVELRPYPRKTLPLDTEGPPSHLAEEQHIGQVVIDCTLGAIQVKPECHASNIHGTDAFSAAAVAWLEGLSVQYAPGTRNGAPALLDHRWRVFFEDFSGTTPHPAASR